MNLKSAKDFWRSSTDMIERSHYQVIWLICRGYSAASVASVTGYGRNWVYQLVRRYNESGPCALGDQRHHNPGQTPLLNEFQLALLWQVLEEPPKDGNLWDGPKVALWMSHARCSGSSPTRVGISQTIGYDPSSPPSSP